MEKSLEFYIGKLGLKIKVQDGGYVGFNDTSFSVFQKDKAVGMFPAKYMGKGGGVVLAVVVEDLKKTCADLKARGVSFFEDPKTTAWGQKVAYFNDPDGIIWEVSEPFEE